MNVGKEQSKRVALNGNSGLRGRESNGGSIGMQADPDMDLIYMEFIGYP